MLHLQCHFGQDTLSWARLGAKVTGVDFSNEAIALANNLKEELNLQADFICANVLELQNHLEGAGTYDIVFTSYGTICWLPDLQKWAEVVAHYLKPSGTFYIVDFHPYTMMYEFETLKMEYSYFYEADPIVEENESTYTDGRNMPKQKEYAWNHSLSETMNALIQQGLEIQSFNEYPFQYYDCFPNLEPIGEGRYVFKELGQKAPHMFAIKARKK